MALPVLGLIAKFIVANGTRAATRKYGAKAIEKAAKQVKARQKAIDAKTLGKSPRPSKASQARSAETNKVKARNRRLEKEMKGRERFDMDGDPLDEVPLKFSKGGGVRARLSKGGPVAKPN